MAEHYKNEKQRNSAKNIALFKCASKEFSRNRYHPTFKEIRNYALTKREARLHFVEMTQHLEICDLCRATYDDICRYDPEICTADNPLPEKLWQAIWQEFQSQLPQEIEDLLIENFKTITADINDIVAREIVAHLADIDYDLRQKLKEDMTKRENLQALEAKLSCRRSSLTKRLASDIIAAIELFHRQLIQSLSRISFLAK